MSIRASSSGHGSQLAAATSPAALRQRGDLGRVSESGWPRLKTCRGLGGGGARTSASTTSSTWRQSRRWVPSPNRTISSPSRPGGRTRQEAEPVALEVLARAVDVREAQHDDTAARAGGRTGGGAARRPACRCRSRRRAGSGGPRRRAGSAGARTPARRRQHDRPSGRSARRLEEREVAAHVEVEVAQRLLHRGQVAHLAGDVEDDVGAGQRGPPRRADVGDTDLDIGAAGRPSTLWGSPPCSGTRASITTTGPLCGQAVDDVRPDEPESARDDAARAGDGGRG